MTNSIFNGGSQVNSVPDSATAKYVPFQNIIIEIKLFNKYLKTNDNGSQSSQEMILDLEPVVTTGKTV